MDKCEKALKQGLLGHKSVLLGSVLIVLALFATSRAVAAPATTSSKSKTAVRTAATELDPIALRPLWLSRISAVKPADSAAPAAGLVRPVTPAVTLIGRPAGIFTVQGNNSPVVHVPARPHPRSPFMPPSSW